MGLRTWIRLMVLRRPFPFVVPAQPTKLPKVDGLEVLRTMKHDRRTKAVPAVVMTSSKEQRDMVEGYQLGVNSYIQKPVDFDAFRDLIKQLGLYWLVVNQPPPPAAFAAD
jgi:two-component system, response regulator